MQETQDMWVRSLGWEDPLEEEMANYSSILAWKISWAEEPGGLRPWGHRVRHSWVTNRTYDNIEQSSLFLDKASFLMLFRFWYQGL